jgi:hypothetical protein
MAIEDSDRDGGGGGSHRTARGGKWEERRRESKRTKNAFIVECCDARERYDILFLFSLPRKSQTDK